MISMCSQLMRCLDHHVRSSTQCRNKKRLLASEKCLRSHLSAFLLRARSQDDARAKISDLHFNLRAGAEIYDSQFSASAFIFMYTRYIQKSCITKNNMRLLRFFGPKSRPELCARATKHEKISLRLWLGAQNVAAHPP
jgi:hypothetical protein